MIKRTYRAHPLMSVKLMRPFLFVLVLPVIKGVTEYVITGKAVGILTLEAAAVSLLAVFAAFSRRGFQISVDNGKIVIKNGILLRREAAISRQNLSSIGVSRNVFDLIFGSVSFKINTEAGRASKTDYSFKLYKEDAKELASLLYGEEKRTEIRFPAVKTALQAAATSSATGGLTVGVPVINNAGKMLGIALNRMLFNGISRASQRFAGIFPPAVNFVTGLLVAGYAASFMITFFKMFGFRLKSGEESVETEFGFFARNRTVFKKSAIRDVCIEQTPVLRLFGMRSARAAVGGYGDKKGEKALLVPAARRERIAERLGELFPFVIEPRQCIRAERSLKTAARFLWPARVFAAADIVAVSALSLIFPAVSRFLVLLGLIFMVLAVYGGSVGLKSFREGGLSLTDGVYACGSRFLLLRELYCDYGDVGEITLKETPADRKAGTCKVKITMRSEGADSVTVKNVSRGQTLEVINSRYNITE